MKKTHTTFQTLLANTFNAHDETGDGLLWLGPVLFDGTIVTIGGYRARYNGIIVEDLALVTHDTAGYKYVCVTGIDASPSSVPYTLVTNTKQGICLIESYKNGWITRSKVFNNDTRGLPFYREADATGTYYYACYGPGMCTDGTVVHAPIKIPMSIDVATGTTTSAGVSDKFYNDATVVYGVVDGHYNNQHLAMFNDTAGVNIFIQNDALGVTQTIAAVNGTSLACLEASAAGCVYAYTVAEHLFVGTCDYVAGPAVPTDYTLPSAIARIDFVTTTTMVIELADSTFIYGRLMPTVVDTISSGSSRWFHVDAANGDFIHIGTDDKLYKNFVQIGTCTSWAFIIDQKIIQLTTGGQIINGTKSTGTGYSVTSVVANRTPSDELFLLFVNGTGVDAVSYDPIHAEITYSAHVSNTAVLAAITFGQNVSYFYLDGDQITFEQPTSIGYLEALPDIEIIPSEDNHWRFGKKHFQLDADYVGGSVYIDSNTSGIISFQATDVYLGELRSHTVADITMFPLLVGPAVSDGDMLESVHIMSGMHGYTKCLAMDISGVPSALLTKTPSVGSIALGARVSISSNINLFGGSCDHMIVNAGDSVVSGMEITLLDINIAKNVIFIGCTIGAYADLAIAPNTNEYQFIGCSIGGVPATDHSLLTGRTDPGCHPDTAVSYDSPQFDYGAGLEDVLTCTEVHAALEQVITRFTGNATWVAGAPDTFVNYLATPTWTTALGDEQIVSITADVLGVAILTGAYSHRKVHATLRRDGFGIYSVLMQDSEIIYEDATFEDARLAPGTYLDGTLNDYVEVTDDGVSTFSVTCAAIDGIAQCRYSVNMIINELIVVDKATA